MLRQIQGPFKKLLQATHSILNTSPFSSPVLSLFSKTSTQKCECLIWSWLQIEYRKMWHVFQQHQFILLCHEFRILLLSETCFSASRLVALYTGVFKVWAGISEGRQTRQSVTRWPHLIYLFLWRQFTWQKIKH